MKKLTYFFYAACLICCLAACSDDEAGVTTTPAPEATGIWMDERDSTEYQWVRYGRLEWTIQNLRYQVTEGVTKPDLTMSPGQFDDGVATKYYDTFGLLYNYEAAMAAVPEGWRLPSRNDWDDLANRTNNDIKGALDLQLGGYYVNDDFFQQIHPNVDYYAYIYGFYWSSTIDETKTGDAFAFYRKLTYNQSGSVCESMDKTNFLSVRLVRDAQ